VDRVQYLPLLGFNCPNIIRPTERLDLLAK
jgi:hypothetical protein